MTPDDWLLLCRSVRFGETDAAGVVHFAHLLRWCHEAYEESLERFGIPAAALFPTPGGAPAVALPIVHCQADFLRPLVCGDALTIRLAPQPLDGGGFEVRYCVSRGRRRWPGPSAATWRSMPPPGSAAPCRRRSAAGWRPRAWRAGCGP